MKQSILGEAFKNAGLDVQSYSGRYMYGSRCLALGVDRGQSLAGALYAAAESIADGTAGDKDAMPAVLEMLREAATEIRWDNLGLGTIYYWPNIRWDAEDGEGQP